MNSTQVTMLTQSNSFRYLNFKKNITYFYISNNKSALSTYHNAFFYIFMSMYLVTRTNLCNLKMYSDLPTSTGTMQPRIITLITI